MGVGGGAVGDEGVGGATQGEKKIHFVAQEIGRAAVEGKWIAFLEWRRRRGIVCPGKIRFLKRSDLFYFIFEPFTNRSGITRIGTKDRVSHSIGGAFDGKECGARLLYLGFY